MFCTHAVHRKSSSTPVLGSLGHGCRAWLVNSRERSLLKCKVNVMKTFLLALTLINHKVSQGLNWPNSRLGIPSEVYFLSTKLIKPGRWHPMPFASCIQRTTAGLQTLHTGPCCPADTQRWSKSPQGEECTALASTTTLLLDGGFLLWEKSHLETFLDQFNLTEAFTAHFLGVVLWLPHWLLSSTSLLCDVFSKSESKPLKFMLQEGL